MKILPSALRHGISPKDIDELLDSPLHIEIPFSYNRKGERYMYVGFVQRFDFPIEVGIDYPPNDETPRVFHADKAREPCISALKGKKHGKKKK